MGIRKDREGFAGFGGNRVGRVGFSGSSDRETQDKNSTQYFIKYYPFHSHCFAFRKTTDHYSLSGNLFPIDTSHLLLNEGATNITKPFENYETLPPCPTQLKIKSTSLHFLAIRPFTDNDAILQLLCAFVFDG